MTVQLTPEQEELLRDLIRRRLDELGPEIRRTETRDYRDELRREYEGLDQLLTLLTPIEALTA